MKIGRETQTLKNEIAAWVKRQTHVIPVGKDTFEVATNEVDAYGDTVYCFIKKEGAGYQISDEGNILFKLDPGGEDDELYQTAAEIAIGAGFDFDEQTASISVFADERDRAQAIVKLAQLQIAISYLD